ncbi:hypothetical protein [Streptomyces luteireticuli]|uniref:Uncharacterized protein n=1 Tax=Streptomyces luteireticuli TaxID=173858 RepID=A0ABP3J2R2_9ACTN
MYSTEQLTSETTENDATSAKAAKVEEKEPACGCRPTTGLSPQHAAETLHARAIDRHLGDLGVSARRRAVGYDTTVRAVALRVQTDHGLYALIVPAIGRPYPILRNGTRAGALDIRRVPGVSDSMIATLYAFWLRDRADL